MKEKFELKLFPKEKDTFEKLVDIFGIENIIEAHDFGGRSSLFQNYVKDVIEIHKGKEHLFFDYNFQYCTLILPSDFILEYFNKKPELSTLFYLAKYLYLNKIDPKDFENIFENSDWFDYVGIQDYNCFDYVYGTYTVLFHEYREYPFLIGNKYKEIGNSIKGELRELLIAFAYEINNNIYSFQTKEIYDMVYIKIQELLKEKIKNKW